MSQRVTTLCMDSRRGSPAHKTQLTTLFEQLARKEQAQRLLRRMGLDPRQFVLFLELFRTLSAREEFMGSAGVNRFNIVYLSYWTGLMGVYVLAFLMFGHAVPPAPVYLLVDLSVTFALTFLVFMREAANSLFNPVEAVMLAHTPIHGPTYAAAKIVHIVIAVLYLVLGLNLYPALIGAIASPGARWFWLVTHLVSALLIGVWTAFIICACYGLIRRLVPAVLLKRVSIWIQVVSMSAFVAIPVIFRSFMTDLFAARYEDSQWTWLPLTWFVEIGRMGCQGTTWRLGSQGAWSILASMLIIWFGLRSFHGTYLSEAAFGDLRQSGGGSKRGVLHRCLTASLSAVTGAADGLAAFCFVSQMIRRDKLFWRAVLMQTWIPLLAVVLVVMTFARFGIYPASHILPHLLGLVILAICINLPTTSFTNASWIYLTSPIGSGRACARGIIGALWVSMVALPHAALLLLFSLFVTWREAAIVAGFDLIVVSLYFAFGIGKISGLPFSSPANESRNIVNSIHIQVCGLMAIAFPIVAQVLVWMKWRYVPGTAMAMGVAIWLVLFLNIERLEREIVWRLYLLKCGPNQMFREYE